MPNDRKGSRSNGVPGGTGSTPDSPREPGRRRRRWRRITAIVVLCILIAGVVLVIALPTVLSSRYGTRRALAILNSRLRGTVEVQDLELSWGGPLKLDGLSVLDPQHRQVLAARKVVVRAGLWGIVRSPMTFGEIELDQPMAVVYLQEDQSASLVQALESRSPVAPPPAPAQREPAPPPAPKGQLVIRSGSVRVVKPDGRELGVTDLNGQVMLNTLNDVRGQIGGQLVGGGQVQAEADVRNLATNGRVDINQATGQFAIRTSQPVALAPLTAFAGRPGIQGLSNLNVQGQLDRGALRTDINTQLTNLYTESRQAEGQPRARPRPINLALAGQIQRTADRTVSGRMDLTGGAGTAGATFNYAPCSQPSSLTGEDFTAMLLAGKPVALPEVQVNAEANLDLRALAEAIPSLLHLREGVEITSGQMRIPKMQVRTQPALAAEGAIEVADLAATRNGRLIQWQPIALDLSAHVVPDEGLNVDKGQLQAGFAAANVQGTPGSFKGQFEADLAKLDEQLRQLVDLGSFQIAGRLDGRFTVARAGEDRLDASSDVQAVDVRYVSGDRQLSVQRATVNQTVSLVLDERALRRVVVKSLDASVDQQITVAAEGWYDLAGKAWQADVNVRQAQLPYLVAKGRELSVQGFTKHAQYSGSIADLRVKADWDPLAGTFASSGAGAVADLGVNGKDIARNVAVEWRGGEYLPAARQAKLAGATIKTDFSDLTAESVEFRPGRTPQARGRVKATADMARTLAAAYALAGKAEQPAVRGQLDLAGDVRTDGPMVTLAGRATISNFAAGEGQRALRQQQVQLTCDAQVDSENETITVRQAELTSLPLTASLAGTLREFRTRRVLDLRGEYQAQWDKVMPIVHELAPAAAETVDLRGQSASRYTLTGPAWQPDVQPPFRGVTAEGLEVGWQSGRLFGIALGMGRLAPRLANGAFDLPAASIPASGGTMSVRGLVDMTRPTPLLRIPGKLEVLRNINLNAQIARQLLSHVNPLFSEVASMEGRVSLLVQDIQLPLGDQIKHSGSGQGHMDLSNLRIEPGGVFSLLAKLGGMTGAKALETRVGNPDFRIVDGRIHYDNFTLIFPTDYDVVFHGSVGFDDTVDLMMSIPVTPNLLSHLGVVGPIVQYANVLHGVRIDVPVAGTRLAPRLSFAGVKIAPLIEEAIKRLALEPIRMIVPGGQLLPALPGEPRQPGQKRELLPGLPLPPLPGLRQPPAQSQP
jgi:hypothetical protein